MTLSERMYEASDGVSRYWAVEVKQLEQENERMKEYIKRVDGTIGLAQAIDHGADPDHFPSEPE